MLAELKPMLCKAASFVPEGDTWVLEPKFDGMRWVVYRDETGKVFSYCGRNSTDRTGQARYIEEAVARHVPPDTALDGEIVGPIRQGEAGCAAVGTLLAQGRDWREGEDAPLHYAVFDMTRHDGVDLRSESWDRRRYLLDMLELPKEGCVQATVFGESTPALHEQFVQVGLEGSVAKRKQSRYVNRRSDSWVKIKSTVTAEARVVGFKEGTGGNAGTIGSFELEMLESGARTSCGLRGQMMHAAVNDDPDFWRDAIVEIKCFAVHDNGVPRSPIFVCRREDLE
jgi:bifunctional non-homologous end joining protein LigD